MAKRGCGKIPSPYVGGRRRRRGGKMSMDEINYHAEQQRAIPPEMRAALRSKRAGSMRFGKSIDRRGAGWGDILNTVKEYGSKAVEGALKAKDFYDKNKDTIKGVANLGMQGYKTAKQLLAERRRKKALALAKKNASKQ